MTSNAWPPTASTRTARSWFPTASSRGAFRPLVGQIDALDEAIGAIDKAIAASVKADETAKRLMTIPGVRPGHRLGDPVATIQERRRLPPAGANLPPFLA